MTEYIKYFKISEHEHEFPYTQYKTNTCIAGELHFMDLSGKGLQASHESLIITISLVGNR
jgi:hypothetical protein